MVNEDRNPLTQTPAVYIFIGSIVMGDGLIRNYVAGSIIAFVGIAYIVLEYIPSIEPPANMRYAVLSRT